MSKQDRKEDDHRQTVGEWLSRSFQWRIPVYQRHYAWGAQGDSGPIHLFWKTVEKQTADLLKDVSPNQHYLGAVIVDNKTEHRLTDGITRYDVVDGQQRLTTIQIALLALARMARDEYHCGKEIWEKLEKCVFCRNKEARLLPTNFDYNQFNKVLSDASGKDIDFGEVRISKDNAKKSKIMAACHYFETAISDTVKRHAQREPREVVEKILDSILDGFDLVLIVLDENDDAQGIFESLNSYAKPLTTFDLIRNNVFRRAAECGRKEGNPKKDVDLFNSGDWQELEKTYWEVSVGRGNNKKPHIESYIAGVLVAKIDKAFDVGRDDIFKTYTKEFLGGFPSIQDEVKALGRYTSVYKHLDDLKKSETNHILPGMDFGIFYYSEWKSRIFYPVMYSIADINDVSPEEKQEMVKLLENYVVRRGACNLTLKQYNQHVATICRRLVDDPNYEGLKRILRGGKAEIDRFPSNDDVMRVCPTANLYESDFFPFRHYVLKELELHMAQNREERGELISKLTVDHILPQAWENNSGWEEMLKGTDAHVVSAHIHTIGNLTLMSQENNSKKSNRSWDETRELMRKSPMNLNRDLAENERWDVERITARSRVLAEKICERWPYPS